MNSNEIMDTSADVGLQKKGAKCWSDCGLGSTSGEHEWITFGSEEVSRPEMSPVYVLQRCC